MSISTGTLNLKFMQRGTPLQATPSKSSIPVPTTPSTPVPSINNGKPSLQREQEEDQWSLPRSTLDRLRSTTGSTPVKGSKAKGRVTYESSYLPFLDRERDRTVNRVGSDDEDVSMSSDEEDKGVGSSRMVKGRMTFGQPIKPEKTYISEEEEPSSKGPKPDRPMVSGNQRWKALGKSFDPTSPSSNPSTPNPKSKRPPKSSQKIEPDETRSSTTPKNPTKTGFIRPGGFEDLPQPNAPTSTLSDPSKPGSSKKSKKKRKTPSKVKEQERAGGNGSGSDSDEILYQGARKKQRKTDSVGVVGSSLSKLTSKSKSTRGGNSSDEVDEFINGIMDELDQE